MPAFCKMLVDVGVYEPCYDTIYITLQAMLRGVEDSIQGRLAEHEMYWHALALKVDYESRWIFNVGYTACWFGLWMMRDTALFD